MKKTAKYVVSGEFLFAVFLLSGVFKETFDWLPIDLTLLMLALTGAISLKRIYKKRYINRGAAVMLVVYTSFLFIVFLSLFYTSSEYYFIEKTLKFTVITSWAFVCPFFLLDSKKSIKKFMFSLSAITVVSSMFVLRNYFHNTNINTNFVSISDGNYLGTARLIGTGSIALLVIYIFKTEITKSYRLLLFIFLIFSSFALILTGARMPLISYALTFLILIFSTVRIKDGKIIARKGTNRVVTLALLLIPSVYFLKDSTFTQTFFYRIQVLFQDGMGNSAAGRLERYETAMNMMKENFLLGGGFGSFGLNYTNIDKREYPHNIFLEVGSELGLMGLLIISTLIITGIVKGAKDIKKGGYLNVWIFASLIYLLVNAMVSGDLNDNRMLFALLGVAAHSSVLRGINEKSTAP